MQSNAGVHELEPPKVVAQRVARTVKRQADRLVRVETEHERFIVTPEHPFATPEGAWIRAGQLAPGDQLVSAKFGTVRVSSVQSEKPAQRVAVFNLGVDPSHTYLVGTNQVLVHNTNCKGEEDPIAEKERQLAEAKRELARLREQMEKSPRDVADLEPLYAATDARIQELRLAIENARKRKTPESSHGEGNNTRKRKAPESSHGEGSTSGAANAPPQWWDDIMRSTEAQSEFVRNELEAARAELRELEGQHASSDEAWKMLRDAQLAVQREIETLTGAHERSIRNLALARQIEELEQKKNSLKTEDERLGIEREISELRDRAEHVYLMLKAQLGVLREEAKVKRTGEMPLDLAGLRQNLRHERRSNERRDVALDNEYRALRDTLDRPGTSNSTRISARLAEIEQARALLRTQWQEHLQTHLDAARQRLLGLQSAAGGLHNPAAEAEVRELIALLEREMQAPF